MRDTTYFNQGSMSLWKGCGATIQSGNLDPATLIPQFVAKNKVAQAVAGGMIVMVLHQVHGDGDGPFVCGIDTAGTGLKGSWSKLSIFTQVPGQSPAENNRVAWPWPLVVKLPEDLTCSGVYGTKENICLIRCQNYATTAPFGGCVPFELVPSFDGTSGQYPIRGGSLMRQQSGNY
ncbi:hypothetical protein TWF694_005998 [Orbilia ellipsospora]|uniref:Uncharacterized protein n=1 Tax=Orbilia ellipsospora TaxID=2528407 RepID=A0AAV9WT71_9PEZI